MTEVLVVSEEDQKVFLWRKQWLVHGGFSMRNADLLASTDVSYDYANQVLRNAKQKGHDEDFVMKLIL
jgi:hypothetical protein